MSGKESVMKSCLLYTPKRFASKFAIAVIFSELYKLDPFNLCPLWFIKLLTWIVTEWGVPNLAILTCVPQTAIHGGA